MTQCAQHIPSFQSSNLILQSDGLWVSKDQSSISYPEEGNEGCYQIEENSFWFQHRNKAIVSLIESFPPLGAIYDIGGGNGFVSLGMKEAGFDVVLVEPGVSGALNAKKRGLDTVVCSTLQDAQFEPHSLPAVGLFDVLEHIEDDVAFLKMIRSALSSDGRLYLTVPAYQWLWSQEDVYAQHYRRYTLSSLSRVFEKAGMKIDFGTYIFSFLPPAIFFLRVLPGLIGLRKTGELDTYQRDHAPGGGVAQNILSRVLSVELSRLKKGGKIPFGGSCLVTASVA